MAALISWWCICLQVVLSGVHCILPNDNQTRASLFEVVCGTVTELELASAATARLRLSVDVRGYVRLGARSNAAAEPLPVLQAFLGLATDSSSQRGHKYADQPVPHSWALLPAAQDAATASSIGHIAGDLLQQPAEATFVEASQLHSIHTTLAGVAPLRAVESLLAYGRSAEPAGDNGWLLSNPDRAMVLASFGAMAALFHDGEQPGRTARQIGQAPSTTSFDDFVSKGLGHYATKWAAQLPALPSLVDAAAADVRKPTSGSSLGGLSVRTSSTLGLHLAAPACIDLLQSCASGGRLPGGLRVHLSCHAVPCLGRSSRRSVESAAFRAAGRAAASEIRQLDVALLCSDPAGPVQAAAGRLFQPSSYGQCCAANVLHFEELVTCAAPGGGAALNRPLPPCLITGASGSLGCAVLYWLECTNAGDVFALSRRRGAPCGSAATYHVQYIM